MRITHRYAPRICAEAQLALLHPGLIRDAYLMKNYYNAVYFLTMIAVQGLIYYGLGTAGIVRIPSYLPPFSLFSIAVGSFMFGFGAVLAGGCMTKTLVECGDGRILGIIKLFVFMICAYLVAAGPLIGVSKSIRTIALIDDNLTIRTTMIPLVIFAVLSVALVISLIRHNIRERIGRRFRGAGRFRDLDICKGSGLRDLDLSLSESCSESRIPLAEQWEGTSECLSLHR